MEAEAESFGRSTDGQGRWHCAGCPVLEDERTAAKVAVMPGQAELGEEMGVDLQERLLRQAGLFPWTEAKTQGGLIPAVSASGEKAALNDR
jgi:hypothetical protein